MVKKVTILCDRCNRELTPANWYGDEEFCNDCILEAELAAEAARADVKRNWQAGTALRKLAGLYGIIEL
jgi:hypothetical protein